MSALAGVCLLAAGRSGGGARPTQAAARQPPPVAVLERADVAAGYGRESRIRLLRIRYVAHDGL